MSRVATLPELRNAVTLAAPVVYADLRSCCECAMVCGPYGRPRAGTMDADTRTRWFDPSLAAVRAIEVILPRPDDLPDWLRDIIDGRREP